MTKCRRCLGKGTIVSSGYDGPVSGVCPVCGGRGVEYRRVYPPAPNRHFSAAADIIISQRDHDEFMSWLEEVDNEQQR